MPRPATRKHQLNRILELSPWLHAGALLGVLCGVSACDGCGSQKPYTPFGVASSLPTPEATLTPAVDVVTPPAASAGFAARKAELVPNAPATWQGSGLSLTAPDAHRFAQVLPADFDGDHTLEALAWLVPAANVKNASPGELWYFPSGAPPRKLSALPGFVPSGPDCALTTTLDQTGEHSATLDVSASCTAPLIARAPARAMVVVSPSVEHPLLLTLRAASAAPDEALTFKVDSSDQDHDGRDDVRLTLGVGLVGANEPASADLAWLDRAAGASRSASEPVSSLVRLAAKVGLQARGKHAATAGARAANVLRLLSSLCAEGGAARVFDEDGAPFRCGDLGKVVDSLAMSDVLAALAQNDFLGAFSTLRRDGWYFGKLSIAQRKAIERELLRPLVKLEAGPAFVARTPVAEPRFPHYSPLWFEPDAALLVQSANTVTRVSADRASETSAAGDGGTPSWPLELALPNGVRVLGAVHACDRSELLLNESDPQHALLPPLPTRILAARPASCTGHGAGPSIAIVPLSFDESGLDALLGGARVSVAPAGKKLGSALPAMGTPRSPDGRWLVSPSALGLLVIGDRKELWQIDKLAEHADAGRLTDCVVANDARAVACLDSGRVIVFEHPKPSVSATHGK